MKIGSFVKHYIKGIFEYCETQDHSEFERLFDPAYSKKTFDINFPFCKETSQISSEESKRYWTPVYVVRGRSVRVTSQWYDSQTSKSRSLFTQYILGKRIASKEDLTDLPSSLPALPSTSLAPAIESGKPMSNKRTNARYRGNAIGNSQNLLVRNILSNLGEESFSDKDWAETKAYFNHRCAYCGGEEELVLEHAVPINRKALGEHRLGNLVPSCHQCNAQKADKDFREFLEDKPEKLEMIELYMDDRNYVPLGDNEQVRMILDMAYQEVSIVANRYLKILNTLFSGS